MLHRWTTGKLLCVCAGKPVNRPSKSYHVGGTATIEVAERPERVGVARCRPTSRRAPLWSASPPPSGKNGAGRINQTTPSVLRDSPPSGRVHCSIRNNINNILVVGTWSMSHASPSTVFRRPDLDIIRSSGDRLRNAHAQAGGKRLRQGSIGAEKRSDIIGGCRMSGSSKNERRRRHNNVVRG